jgi:hypothetical protein
MSGEGDGVFAADAAGVDGAPARGREGGVDVFGSGFGLVHGLVSVCAGRFGRIDRTDRVDLIDGAGKDVQAGRGIQRTVVSGQAGGAERDMMKALYKHRKSGDVFGIETDEGGRVVGTCGPLFGEGFDPKVLDYDEYWNREVAAKLGEFERVSKDEYLELLQANGFYPQISQGWLW